MRNASYIGKFYKGGEHLFDAVMFGGYVGVLSGFRPSGWAVTENSRHNKKGLVPIFDTLSEIFDGKREVGFAVRDTLTECVDFECAFNKLSTV